MRPSVIYSTSGGSGEIWEVAILTPTEYAEAFFVCNKLTREIAPEEYALLGNPTERLNREYARQNGVALDVRTGVYLVVSPVIRSF